MATQITRLGFVNAYLVEEEEGITVVDTTVPGGHKAILAAAERRGRPIVRIALTHGHGDHVGGLDKLAAAVPEAEVLITETDARILAGDKAPQQGKKLRGSWPSIKRSFGRHIAPGDRVGSLEVHAAPGHTPGQVAFLDPRDGTLYCGDAFATIGRVATCAKPSRRFPLPGVATWHKGIALESARALRALDPAALAPGHGKVVERPGAAMDAAIAK